MYPVPRVLIDCTHQRRSYTIQVFSLMAGASGAKPGVPETSLRILSSPKTKESILGTKVENETFVVID